MALDGGPSVLELYPVHLTWLESQWSTVDARVYTLDYYSFKEGK